MELLQYPSESYPILSSVALATPGYVRSIVWSNKCKRGRCQAIIFGYSDRHSDTSISRQSTAGRVKGNVGYATAGGFPVQAQALRTVADRGNTRPDLEIRVQRALRFCFKAGRIGNHHDDFGSGQYDKRHRNTYPVRSYGK